MCEPAHSIVQYPNEPTGPMARLGEFGKKILDWFHFSKMGAGHSGAMNASPRHHEIPTSYEAFWWDRSFKIDGYFTGHSYDRERAYECALEYANITSIGSLHALRKFLEASLKSTYRADSYEWAFMSKFLNSEGKEHAHARMKRIGKMSSEQLSKFMLGYTRKRSLLVPEWADDDKLWSPG